MLFFIQMTLNPYFFPIFRLLFLVLFISFGISQGFFFAFTVLLFWYSFLSCKLQPPLQLSLSRFFCISLTLTLFSSSLSFKHPPPPWYLSLHLACFFPIIFIQSFSFDTLSLFNLFLSFFSLLFSNFCSRQIFFSFFSLSSFFLFSFYNLFFQRISLSLSLSLSLISFSISVFNPFNTVFFIFFLVNITSTFLSPSLFSSLSLFLSLSFFHSPHLYIFLLKSLLRL